MRIKKIFKRFNNERSGTTLVELLIALSIFSIFVAMAIGGFVQSLANQRLALKLMSATDNMSLTLEQMLREMRVGGNFVSGSNGNSLQFDKSDLDEMSGETVLVSIRYWLDDERIWRSVESADGSSVPVSKAITADNVTISYFKVEAVSEREGAPHRINIVIGVTAKDRGISITNYIQTSVSNRVF